MNLHSNNSTLEDFRDDWGSEDDGETLLDNRRL